MNIIDEMRIRGGMPTEAELVRDIELIRRARERAVPRRSWRESMLALLAPRDPGTHECSSADVASTTT